jgi:hypothetical protein
METDVEKDEGRQMGIICATPQAASGSGLLDNSFWQKIK